MKEGINELVARIKSTWPGSSTTSGVMYHDLPFPPFDKLRSHRKGTKIRWDLFTSHISVKGKSVLDLGCSVGAFCVLSALNGATKIVGIDYDPESIEVAKGIAEAVGVRNVEFRNNVIDSKLIEGLENFDLTIWLANWMWIVKQAGMDEARRLLSVMSKKSGAMVFESAADDGRGGIKGMTQAGIEKIFRENTCYTKVKNIGYARDGWVKRNILIGEK